MPPPVPPSVKLGRMMAGKPISLRLRPAAPLQRVRDAERADSRPILVIASLEELAVLGLVDRLALGADQLDAVFLQHAVASAGPARVERGLPPMVGSSASGAPSR
jgi:hypothetical protein